MAVSSNIAALSSVSENLRSISHTPAVKQGGPKFSEVLDKIRVQGAGGTDLFKDISTMQQRIVQGGNVTPRELILYQITAGQFNLRVELVSKVAESVMVSLRKFQTNA